MERVEISILDRNLTLSVDASEKDKLLTAVKNVDQLMQSIKASAPNLSVERIAIMASIKLASDVLSVASDDGPFKGIQFGEFQGKIESINALLDSTIDELKAV
ncbi:cell division protein ZapA [Pelistega europaea]|uniref:Cell division protein ZapA n=1 Tax=Pelistega europaea TaxID=106147 RepID=A0A7Y4LBK2_9BURK|nr:cell division protein ZapA [Pelistega europaea]NOL50492.1 cell division protein ZapA [Pelistega europaea]